MSFRICTIGCGSIAQKVHGPSYLRYAETYPDTELIACCDIDSTKARSFQEQFGFQNHYTNFEQMLDQEKPDAVCLVVPPQLTAKLSVNILNKGYPLFLEKPPGISREETMGIVRAAEKNAVPHKVAFNRWYLPMMAEAKRMMRSYFSKEEIHHIHYDFFRVNRKDSNFETTVIHGISAVYYLADSPFRKVRFHYQELPKIGRNVTNTFMDCEFESGSAANLNFCPMAGVVIERATVNALGHTFFIQLPIWSAYDQPGRLVHLCNGRTELDLSGDQLAGTDEMFITNGFYAENESFFNDIRAGRKPLGDARTSLQFMELADCIRLRKNEYVDGRF